MKKIIIFTIFLTTSVFSQNITKKGVEIIYSMKNQDGKMLAFKLEVDDNISCYSPLGSLENFNMDFKNPKFTDMSLFKNYSENLIVYTDKILGEKFLVKDSLNSIEWQLSNNTLEILNLTCKSAVTLFRGREYKAYYTDRIMIPEGPWKFYGLPGLILKIESLDSEYVYEAISINNNVQIKNTLHLEFQKIIKRNQISWENFKLLFKKKMDEHIQYLKTLENPDDSGLPNYFKYSRPEIIYKDLQFGDGIKY